MDPLRKLSPDIHHLVFQHFDAKEVLDLSKISKDWHQTIGNEKCLKICN